MWGETVGMKWRKSARYILLAAAFAGLWGSGCGSSSSANQVVVAVNGQFSRMVPTQTQTIAANVTGATDVTSTFACAYTTTPNPTTAVPSPKPSASASCDSAKTASGDPAVGTLTPIAATGTTSPSTATFTAPKVFPDQTKLPNVIVTITATSNADKKKTGTFTITFDSGIRITLSPATATLGTSSTQQFIATDLNGNVIDPTTLTWGVTFEATAKTNSASCSGGTNDCGSVTTNASNVEVYTAPAAVPAAAPASTTTPVNPAGIVTVYAFSKIDNAQIAQAAVTIVKALDITYSGFSPTVAPQGGLQQDIFLAATNATSQIGVTMDPTDSTCKQVPAGNTIDPAQIKVVFAAGTTTSSIGARVRFNTPQHPDQLKTPGFYQIQVTSSNTSIKVNTIPANATFCLQILPVRPTIVGTSPDNFQESKLGQTTNGVPFVIDGGYFGPADSPTVAANFDGQSVLPNNSPNTAVAPTARRINSFLPPAVASGNFAGLFPVSVTYTTSPAPFTAPNPTSAFSNMAVIPDYGGTNPPIDIVSNQTLTKKQVSQPPPPNPPNIYCPSSAPLVTPPPPAPPTPLVCASPVPLVSFAPGSAPSSIAMDPADGLAIVTLAGVNSNNVQYISLAGSAPAVTNQVSSGGNFATGVAVDDQLTLLPPPAQPNLAAVVNYASKSLSLLSVPAGAPVATVDLSCVIPQTDTTCKAVPEPFPYSVGVDPFSHRAVVAFASTNVGLILNLDKNANVTCLPNPAWTPPYCPINFITLNTGPNPQVAFEPGARVTYVTPGGAGLLSGVDLAHPSAGPPADILTASRASNVVTITTAKAHNLNSANPGTVLISGLPLGTSKTDFNGSFSVGQILDSTHFQYFQAANDDTSTCIATCRVSSGTPFLTYSISASIVGIAFNPITRNAVLADPNATFSQLTFIDPKSQTVSSMSLFSEETGPATTGAPEIGAAEVAFQPFTNTAVSFNSKSNEVSLLDPSLSQRPAIVTTGQSGLACFTSAGAPLSCASTTPVPVAILGALAVDPVNNLVLTLNTGSGTLTGFKLGNIKTVHIERVQTPAIDGPNISAPANFSPAAKISLRTAPQQVGPVRILGSGFGATPLQVRLDGVDVTTLGATVTPVGSQELDVTFPAFIPGTTPPAPVFPTPRHYALDVVTSAPTGLNHSNVVDFTVIEEILLPPCNVSMTSPNGTPAAPGGVAIDEAHNLAVVTNTGSGCNQVTVFSLNPANIFNQTLKTIATGATPIGVAVAPNFAYIGQPAGTSGLAVVTNNGSNTVSLIDLVNGVPVTDNTKTPPAPIVVTVGTNPSGVAIDQETNLAVVANTGSNNVYTIDLTPIAQDPSNSAKTIGTLTPGVAPVDPSPTAVAIDPDRGTNGRGLAVVSCTISNGASSPSGALDAVDIGGSTPVRSTSASASFLTAAPTGVVFDPSVATTTANPGVFYAVSTQGNVITTFNPDSGSAQTIKVGINPSAIAYNFQTGTILTVNSLSNTISIVDSQTFSTKATLGIGGASNFAAAIQTFTNLAVIADQANNRVLLFPLPK